MYHSLLQDKLLKDNKMANTRSKIADDKEEPKNYGSLFKSPENLRKLQNLIFKVNILSEDDNSVYQTNVIGVVIEDNNKKYVLTTFYEDEDIKILDASFKLDSVRFHAEKKCIDDLTGLLLLEVDHHQFQKLSNSIEIGDLVVEQQNIEAITIPIGGKDLKVTPGKITNVELDGDDINNIIVSTNIPYRNQVVLANNKLVGLISQVGKIIPTPFIKHLLSEAAKGKEICDPIPSKSKPLPSAPGGPRI